MRKLIQLSFVLVALVAGPTAAQDAAAQDAAAQDAAAQESSPEDPAARDPAAQDPAAQDPAAKDGAQPEGEGEAAQPDVPPSPEQGEVAGDPSESSLTDPQSDPVADPAAGSEPGREEGPISFLVTEVEVVGNLPVDAASARDVLATRFGRLSSSELKGQLEVRSMGDVESTLDRAALLAMVGGEGGDLEKISEMIDADRVVYGRIAQVGSVIDVSVRVVNTRAASLELSMSRRLKADAEPALILSVLDRQADKLLAWVVENYTDGAPSQAFEELGKRKLGAKTKSDDGTGTDKSAAEPAEKKPEPVEASGSNSWSFTFIGLSGAAMTGAGFMLLATAATIGVTGAVNLAAIPVPLLTEGLIGAGGMLLIVLGIGIMAIDTYFWFSE